MGIFRKLFGKKRKEEGKRAIAWDVEFGPDTERDEASGYEPIPRFPGSIMHRYSRPKDRTDYLKEDIYIEYKTRHSISRL